jgi:hypothetical protein
VATWAAAAASRTRHQALRPWLPASTPPAGQHNCIFCIRLCIVSSQKTLSGKPLPTLQACCDTLVRVPTLHKGIHSKQKHMHAIHTIADIMPAAAANTNLACHLCPARAGLGSSGAVAHLRLVARVDVDWPAPTLLHSCHGHTGQPASQVVTTSWYYCLHCAAQDGTALSSATHTDSAGPCMPPCHCCAACLTTTGGPYRGRGWEALGSVFGQ